MDGIGLGRRFWLGVGCWLVLAGAGSAVRADDASGMAQRVDALLEQAWVEAGIEPAPVASDAEFCRRAYLDLTGRIPTVSQVRTFLADDGADKRLRLIEKLLQSPAHATHMARLWRDALIPDDSQSRRFAGGTFENWLRSRFAENRPYNQTAVELLTATGNINQTGPALFYSALEGKPERLASQTARVFLGMQIECAQCHDHPFDRWSQRDFWGLAAFFARLARPQGPQQRFLTTVADVETGEVTLPDSDEVVPPRFPGAAADDPDTTDTRRERLARWITSPENPYFAKATVNRAWALLFGIGLVDPVDGFSTNNPPSHPQILEELADDFVAHGYDMRRLLRILATTRAYGLTSETVTPEPPPAELFARMVVKTLSAEQILDCLETAVCRRDPPQAARGFGNAPFNIAVRQAFLAKFESPGHDRTQFHGGIPQALTMMNGDLIAELTDPARCDLLIALTESPFFTDEQRIETLFLATVSRYPTEEERRTTLAYLQSRTSSGESARALADILWALLNSGEFLFNH